MRHDYDVHWKCRACGLQAPKDAKIDDVCPASVAKVITINPTEPRRYANFCHVQRSMLDATLTFMDALPTDDVGTPIQSPIIARLVVPLTMLASLADVLTKIGQAPLEAMPVKGETVQ